MPLYTLQCENEHVNEVICKFSDLEQHLKKCYKISCDAKVHQQFDMHNKPLVVDRDLITARNHSGKKWN